MGRHQRKWWAGAGVRATVVALMSGCASTTPPSIEPGFQLLFGPATACQETSAGTGQLPQGIAKLQLRWASVDGQKSGTVSAASSAAAKGYWELKLPAMAAFSVDVCAFDAKGGLLWHGRTDGLEIVDQKQTETRVFLAPVVAGDSAALACAGNKKTGGAMQVGRSLAGSARLPSGDAVIAGGMTLWNTDKLAGAGDTTTDVYDYQLGAFRKGPELQAARIQPHVHAVGQGMVLVAGGLSGVVQQSSAGLPLKLMMPDALAGGVPAIKAELIDATATGKAVQSPADVGVGALAMSSSAHVGDTLVFVGGLDATTGAAVASATVLGDLGSVASGGAGQSQSVALAAARVRPGLLAFPDDGTTIVWGGATSGKLADLVELLPAGSGKGTAVGVSGDAALTGSNYLQTAGAAVVPLAVAGDQLTFLVTGGVPLASPLVPSNAPQYVVVLDRVAKTAVLKPVTIDGGAGKLPGGLGVVGVPLADGRVLLAGGLLATKTLPDCPGQTGQCVLDDWLVVGPLGGGDTPTLPVVARGKLAGTRFGMTGVALPAGVLLTGGQAGVTTADVFAAGFVAQVAPVDVAAVCGK
jgi:hypothetical protein